MPYQLVPPGYHSPLAIVSANDHTAWILIAASLGIVYSLVFGAIRAFVRCTIGRGFGANDITLAVATVLGLVQSSVILAACHDGLGKSTENVPQSKQAEIQQMYYGSNILFIVAIGLSKGAVVQFLLQLTAKPSQRRVFYSALGVISIWTFASLFALALQCNLSHPSLLIGQKCSAVVYNASITDNAIADNILDSQWLRWQVICGLDIVLEVAIVTMAVYLVWGVQISWSKKATVVSAFAFRLILIVPIGFRLATFNTTGLTINPTLLESRFIVCTQVELSYSLISATIPVLRPVIKDLVTNYGVLSADHPARTYGSDQSKHTMSYEMSNLRQTLNGSDGPCEDTIELHPAARESKNAYSYDITAPGVEACRAPDDDAGGKANRDTNSVGSNDSKQMIIKKQISFFVEHETL